MKKVLLLLAEGFEIYEASVFIDVIGWNLLEGDGSTRLYTCGLRKQIKSTFGQGFIVDLTIDEIEAGDFDALAIPGGFDEYNFYNDAYDEKFLELIRKFNSENKIIASICTGALPVGKSGVLHGRNGTTYNRNPQRHETLRSFGVNVINKPVVVDKNIITSWNPSTAMEVAFKLLALLTSEKQAEKIKYLMGFIEAEPRK
jgi:4-methyl-5(b-hydroxyethyl)-thiazole monophosphate biosynthesis